MAFPVLFWQKGGQKMVQNRHFWGSGGSKIGVWGGPGRRSRGSKNRVPGPKNPKISGPGPNRDDLGFKPPAKITPKNTFLRREIFPGPGRKFPPRDGKFRGPPGKFRKSRPPGNPGTPPEIPKIPEKRGFFSEKKGEKSRFWGFLLILIKDLIKIRAVFSKTSVFPWFCGGLP